MIRSLTFNCVENESLLPAGRIISAAVREESHFITNKSLDASGGGVFRIKLGPAMRE
jgi:hypothetical protein